MAEHVLDIAAFRILFPPFSNETLFPDIRLESVWGLATGYIGNVDGPLFGGTSMQYALDLMTAHLLQLQVMAEAGTLVNAALTGATVDKVQVQFAPPPFKDGWTWWLCQTPYGAQLWALLSVKSAGGFFVRGNPEREGFRRVGGGFGPGWPN